MIPKIIHQVWLGGSIPEKFKTLHAAMRDMNPAWCMQLWDEAKIHAELCTATDYAHATKAGASNVVRLKALQKYGGVYFDLDFVVLQPFDVLEKYTAFVARQPDGVLCNAAMGAAPNHPWINAMLANYGDYQQKDAAWGCYVIEPHLTADVAILPTDIFYPYGHDEKPKPPTAATLAYHLWEGSWL